MQHASRIEICGGIGAGKTTLAQLLAERLGCAPVLESFRSNPFWERFYRSPADYVLEKNICFLAQHFGDLKETRDRVAVCDFACFQDLAYASMTGDGEHEEVMARIHSHLSRTVSPPTLIVRVLCDERIQMDRIRARGRPEELAIDIGYLVALNAAIDRTLKAGLATVLDVRSDELDFVTPSLEAIVKLDELTSAFEHMDGLRDA